MLQDPSILGLVIGYRSHRVPLIMSWHFPESLACIVSSQARGAKPFPSAVDRRHSGCRIIALFLALLILYYLFAFDNHTMYPRSTPSDYPLTYQKVWCKWTCLYLIFLKRCDERYPIPLTFITTILSHWLTSLVKGTEMLCRYIFKERNVEGHPVMDFTEKEMVIVERLLRRKTRQKQV